MNDGVDAIIFFVSPVSVEVPLLLNTLFLSESVDLVPGERYRLAVRDAIWDGMCCDYGQGPIAVYATVDGEDEVLTSSDGFFTGSDDRVFTVP